MRIGLVAGEASGDVLGAGLIGALRRRQPEVRVEGVAGHAMQAAGCEVWEPADALAVMGLVEPLREIPRLVRLRRDLIRRWRSAPPDVFVGIDAPDFNLGLERALKSAGIPTVHYVSPSVWAWRQRRVRKIARSADLILCLFPFEKAFYDRYRVPAEFVGHPLADLVSEHTDRAATRRALGIEAPRVLTVMPGSRVSEVARLGPVFIAASRLLREQFPDLVCVTPTAGERTRALFARQLEVAAMDEHYTVLQGSSDAAILAGDVVLLASGTAALEAALHARAMVAAYKVAPVTYSLARLLRLVKVRHITLPNHLTSEPLVPELLQRAANPVALARSVAGLLSDEVRRQSIESRFAALRAELAQGANERAAAAILQLAARAGAAA